MAIGKISIDTTHRAVPRRSLSFLYFIIGAQCASSGSQGLRSNFGSERLHVRPAGRQHSRDNRRRIVLSASEIFRSQAPIPVKRAAFWIKHVCLFGGNHLHSADDEPPLYSYIMLDVLAFISILQHSSPRRLSACQSRRARKARMRYIIEE